MTTVSGLLEGTTPRVGLAAVFAVSWARNEAVRVRFKKPGPAISTFSQRSSTWSLALIASATSRGGRFSFFARPRATSAW